MGALIDVGTAVRYPRTGTVGTITRIEERNGSSFAQLDTTGMLYRTDLLVPAVIEEKTAGSTDREELLRQVEDERSRPRDLSFEETPNLDGACNGAG